VGLLRLGSPAMQCVCVHFCDLFYSQSIHPSMIPSVLLSFFLSFVFFDLILLPFIYAEISHRRREVEE